MAPPLGTPELQKELADIARRIVENGKGRKDPWNFYKTLEIPLYFLENGQNTILTLGKHIEGL